MYGDGEPAARMLRAAVDAYGHEGTGLVDAMLHAVRGFVELNPDFDAWGRPELEYTERNAELFEAYLTR